MGQAELANAGSYALVVLCLTFPWIGDKPGGQDWRGHREARRLISNVIQDTKGRGERGGTEAGGYANVIAIAGDAHMLAFDDGTNTDYSDAGLGQGFPLVHAAPLHNYGSAKGGPYSDGCYGYLLNNNEQYATMEVTDTGGRGPDAITLNIELRKYGGELVLQKIIQGPLLGKSSGKVIDCQLEFASPLVMGAFVSILALCIVNGILACMVCCKSGVRSLPTCSVCSVLGASVLVVVLQMGLQFLTLRASKPLNDAGPACTLSLLAQAAALPFLLLFLRQAWPVRKLPALSSYCSSCANKCARKSALRSSKVVRPACDQR